MNRLMLFFSSVLATYNNGDLEEKCQQCPYELTKTGTCWDMSNPWARYLLNKYRYTIDRQADQEYKLSNSSKDESTEN